MILSVEETTRPLDVSVDCNEFKGLCDFIATGTAFPLATTTVKSIFIWVALMCRHCRTGLGPPHGLDLLRSHLKQADLFVLGEHKDSPAILQILPERRGAAYALGPGVAPSLTPSDVEKKGYRVAGAERFTMNTDA